MRQDMIYVYEIYRAGSFSQAAESLFMSQPALSIAVKKIEQDIGMPLFDRSYQPLRLTDAGRVYIRRIEEIRELEKDLENELQDLARLETGALSLGGTQYFNSHMLPAVLNTFLLRYPNVQVTLHESNYALIEQYLKDGSADLVFHCGPVDLKNNRSIDICRDHLLFAVPASYPVNQNPAAISAALSAAQIRAGRHLEKDCPAVSFGLFADTPLVLLGNSNDLHQRALSICRRAGFEPRVRFQAEQLETACYMAAHGLGAAFVSDRIVCDTDVVAGLVFYRLDAPEAVRQYRAVVRKNGYVSHLMQIIIGMLKEQPGPAEYNPHEPAEKDENPNSR